MEDDCALVRPERGWREAVAGRGLSMGCGDAVWGGAGGATGDVSARAAADQQKNAPPDCGRGIGQCAGGLQPAAHQPMWLPPLSEKSAPVAKPASAEASQETIEAISSGVPRRLTGMVPTILASTSSRIAFTMSVPM